MLAILGTWMTMAVCAAPAPPVERLAPVGAWPAGFAYALDRDEERGWGFVGSGGVVRIVPLGDDPRPREGWLPIDAVAEVATDGFVFDLEHDGESVWIAASRAGLWTFRVAEALEGGAARPALATGDVAWDVAARGGLVAVAAGHDGLHFLRAEEAQAAVHLEVPGERMIAVALGDGDALAASAGGALLRVALDGDEEPRVTARRALCKSLRSIEYLDDGRHALVAADDAGLLLVDAATLATVRTLGFILPADLQPREQRLAREEQPLCASRVRVLGERAVVGLESTPLERQQSPFTPEGGAWRGEEHYGPWGGVAVVDLAPGDDGAPGLTLVAQLERPRDRPWLEWIKDVAILPGGAVLALDFTVGVLRFDVQPAEAGAPARLVEGGLIVETRAGALDAVVSPTDPRLVYVSSDVGKFQVLDVSDPERPRLLARVVEAGGTFLGAVARREAGPDGAPRDVDYAFINDFFRVQIVRIDPRRPGRPEALQPLWITVPEAVRSPRPLYDLGVTPRSYRVMVNGEFLDVVATNTVFGLQRFRIDDVLAATHTVNIYAHLPDRTPVYARHCEPLWRGVTSPDLLRDGARILAQPAPAVGRAMSIWSDGRDLVLGCGGLGGGGRGGRGGRGAAPIGAHLLYFDLTEPVEDHALLGRLRFPRALSEVADGGILVALERRGDLFYVADTAGYVRACRFDRAPAEAGLRGANHFDWLEPRFENHGPRGLDSVFDVLLDGDALHVACWSSGYARLDAGGDAAAGSAEPFLVERARYDSPGLGMSLLQLPGRRIGLCDFNAGFRILAPAAPGD